MADPVIALAVSVVVGWATTLYFGRRVAHVRLDRLFASTSFVTLTAVGGARLHYLVASSTGPTIGARLGESGVHAGGGIIGLAIGLLILPRVAGFSAAVLADVTAISAGPALAMYRFGCQVRGCCFGTVSHLPWAVRYDDHSAAFLLHLNAGLVGPGDRWSAPVHPLPLYFAAAALLITALGWNGYGRRRYDGEIALVSFVLFSLSTLALEPLRAVIPGQAYWGPLRQLVWISGGMSVASVLLLAAAELRVRHGRFAADH